MRRSSERAYTFIELMMTIGFVAIVFVPMIQLFGHGLAQMREAAVRQTAIDLAEAEWTRFKLSRSGTESAGDMEGEAGLKGYRSTKTVNGVEWVVELEIVPGTAPAEVWIRVFKLGEPVRPEYELVTFFSDRKL